MDRYDPFEKLSDLYDSIVDWQNDPLIKPDNQNKYLFSDGKTYYEELCKILKLLSTFKTGFNQIYDNLDELEEQIHQSGVTQEELNTAINNLHTIITGEIATLESSLSSDISDLDTSLTALTSRVGTNETNISALQTLTSTHTSDINTINTAITSIQADLLTKISDAPQDGKTYGRKNGTWTEVTGGGGGATSDYDALDNKPQINGNTLSGNKTGTQLGLVDTSTLNEYIESDSLLNQEFIYRQSQAKHDGLLNINKIKGNTLVFNQLISEQFTHTFTGGVSNQNVDIERIKNIVSGHKYLYAITQENSMTSNVRNTLQYLYSNGTNITVNESNDPNHNLNSGRYGWIFTAPSDNVNNWISLYYWCHTPNVNVTIKDAILVDLTLMFGVGNEPTTVSDFTDLFQLPYYNYNVGSLLSFNGTGLKTENSTQSENNTLSLPISTYFPTGMKSVGTTYDELTESKAITRIGTRAYQSGDESDTSVITDGTSTYYILDIPTEQDIDINLTSPIWNSGTEQLLPINTSNPVTPIICDITYMGINDEILSLYNKILDIVSDMLTKTDASSLYQTISGMSAYLTSATASSTYTPLNNNVVASALLQLLATSITPNPTLLGKVSNNDSFIATVEDSTHNLPSVRLVGYQYNSSGRSAVEEYAYFSDEFVIADEDVSNPTRIDLAHKILSGTSEPTSALGNNGDIYIKYDAS